MKTEHLNPEQLAKAAQLIQAGEVVAFPTDTVYGLGADARNEAAVQKIFTAKNRPADRALTILLAEQTAISQYAKNIPTAAEALIEQFWPGPLTIVLEAKEGLAPSVSAGLKTVGMRMPANQVALDFIQACGFPIAAPSANLSGRPSPTTAEHVLADLNGKIAAVIDGGETESGLESTVLDLSNPEQPLILRPGGVTRHEIEAVIQQKVAKKVDHPFKDTKEKHYEPTIPIYMVESDWAQALEQMQTEKIALLASEEIIQQYGEQVAESYSLGDRTAVQQANKVFFKAIRALEKSTATVILAEVYPVDETSEAYLNRLEKAANGKRI